MYVCWLSNHVDAGDRKAMQAMQMKDWLTQQMEEKVAKKKMEKDAVK